MSEPDAPEDLDAIAARARRSAEVFLRDEFRDRRRQCFFATGALFILGVVDGLLVAPTFGLDAVTTTLGVAIPMLGAVIIFFMRFRCPRCEKLPVTWTTPLHHRTLDLPGCPHCGLPFHEPERQRE